MKIQIQCQLVRIRLDESELACLLAGQSVENHTALAGMGKWSQTVHLHPQPMVELTGSPQALVIGLPHAPVLALSARLPSREGLLWELSGTEQPLQLQLDVDIRDSRRQRGAPHRVHAPITPSV